MTYALLFRLRFSFDAGAGAGEAAPSVNGTWAELVILRPFLDCQTGVSALLRGGHG